MKSLLSALTLLALALPIHLHAELSKTDRKALESRYPDSNDESKPKTYLVVKKAGIPANPNKVGSLGIVVRDFPKAEVKGGSLRITEPYAVVLQPGTVVTLLVRRVKGDNVEFWVRTLNAYQVERGRGAFKESSNEQVNAQVKFLLDKSDGPEEAIGAIEEWFAPYGSYEEAAKFGNTASGAFVKEIKLGMTIAEVEAVFGPPRTRVDLGERVLYKYPDMTVEFTAGKVSDVK